jgi:hypothetical protein
MARARQMAEWDRLAALMAHLANCHKSSKSRPFTALDFHPLRRKGPPVLKMPPKDFVHAMASILGGPH